MPKTYVCGHRNPDTDSIVSAMAYAALNSLLGEKGYVPARLGHVNDETAFLLKGTGRVYLMRDRFFYDHRRY